MWRSHLKNQSRVVKHRVKARIAVRQRQMKTIRTARANNRQKWGEYIMIRQKVTITNPTGLHLRPAGMFCNIASRYKCKVEFMYNDDTAANAKSVLSVLGACVKSGDEIELICDGEDEEEAMKAMVDAVESGLGE